VLGLVGFRTHALKICAFTRLGVRCILPIIHAFVRIWLCMACHAVLSVVALGGGGDEGGCGGGGSSGGDDDRRSSSGSISRQPTEQRKFFSASLDNTIRY
jgi:hypothetical protein